MLYIMSVDYKCDIDFCLNVNQRLIVLLVIFFVPEAVH